MSGVILRRSVRFVLLLAMLVVPLGASAAPPDAGRERVIVVLHDTAGNPADIARELSQRHNGQVGFVYQHALKGFSAELPSRAIAAIARDSRVASVEVDQVVTAFDMPTGVDRIEVDQKLDLGDTTVTAIDADVAILDTGISSHPDLTIAGGVNCSGGSPLRGSCTTGGFADGNGHGTHVAGTVAALDDGFGVVGVAPGARLWAVKVLNDNGSGYMSWIAAGIDWVTSQAATIEVANMSLGCECSSAAMDTAITNSTAGGVVYVVAAGNSGKNASTFSPANHPNVIAVSAMADFDGKAGAAAAPTCRSDVGTDDTFATFSNFGNVVDIAAPGVCIESTVPGGGYASYSGTSMASPHVAGAAALYVVDNSVLMNSNRWSAVRSGLQSSTWSVLQGDDCGFSGGRSSERFLMLATPCTVASGGGTPPPPATGTISGTVTSSTGGAIADATVTVDGTSLSATTDGSGDYTINDVPVGTDISVTASASGYVSQTKTTAVADGGTSTLDFVLEPAPVTGALSVSVSTNKTSYAIGENVVITVAVTDGSAPVDGASVALTILTASGRTYTGSGTTDSSGAASFSFKIKNPDGKGEYTVSAVASKSGFTDGSGSTTFTVS